MASDSININWLFGEGQPILHFFMLSLIIIGSAIGVVTVRNLVHAAMLMSLCFVGVAGIFILCNAEFLAGVQVLIYAGAIVVLVIFAIMLSENIVGKNIVAHNRQSITALLISLVMGVIMISTLLISDEGKYIGHLRWMLPASRKAFPLEDNSVMVGKSLMSTYTLAFWIASIILMIAMIGALIIARAEDAKAEEKKVEEKPTEGEEVKSE